MKKLSCKIYLLTKLVVKMRKTYFDNREGGQWGAHPGPLPNHFFAPPCLESPGQVRSNNLFDPPHLKILPPSKFHNQIFENAKAFLFYIFSEFEISLIWKTLLHRLKEHISSLQQETEILQKVCIPNYITFSVIQYFHS